MHNGLSLCHFDTDDVYYYFLFEFLATKPKDLNKDGEHTETNLTDAADRNKEADLMDADRTNDQRENTDDDSM